MVSSARSPFARRSRLWLVGFLTTAACTVGGASSRPDLSVSAAWDSAYVSEGRDNLGEGGLFSTSADLTWHHLSLNAWAARGDGVHYREYNLAVGYAVESGPLTTTIGYTRLEYGGIGEAPGDNEFSQGFELSAPGDVAVSILGRYATEAEGTFVEASLRRTWETGIEGISLVPYVLAAFDFGYASAEYDGANHLEAGVAVDYAVADRVICSCYLSRCWAAGDVHRDGGHAITWGGARVVVEL